MHSSLPYTVCDRVTTAGAHRSAPDQNGSMFSAWAAHYALWRWRLLVIPIREPESALVKREHSRHSREAVGQMGKTRPQKPSRETESETGPRTASVLCSFLIQVHPYLNNVCLLLLGTWACVCSPERLGFLHLSHLNLAVELKQGYDITIAHSPVLRNSRSWNRHLQ